MQTTTNPPNRATKNRPVPSPLLAYWTRHPQHVRDALTDATGSIEQAKAMRRELDAVARGQVDPDTPGMRMLWAFLGLAGAHGLLDRQRAWHREQAAGGKR